MKTWYDKRGHECYGYARGSIKATLDNPCGLYENSKFWYFAIEDEGGNSVYRQNKKTKRIDRVYYRSFGD